VNAYDQGEYLAAIKNFNQAENLRKLWPAETKRFYWSDFARDYYLQAMAYNRLLEPNAEQKKMAMAFFEKAETLYESHPFSHIEYLDILERIRKLAKEEIKP